MRSRMFTNKDIRHQKSLYTVNPNVKQLA